MGGAVVAIGAMIGVVGAVGVVWPTTLSAALNNLKSSPRKLYGFAVARLVIGVVLILSASSTAFPMVLRIVGVIAILRALMIPILGLGRIRSLIDWLQARPPLFLRVLGLTGAAFGAFLIWAAIKQ